MTWSQLLSIYNSIPTSFWELAGTALATSPLLSAIKHFFQIESTKRYTLVKLPFVKNITVSGEQIMVLLLVAISGIASGVAYVMGTSSSNPDIIALHGALIAFSTQPIYFFIVKPVYKSILGSIQAGTNADTLKSAVVPAGGVPLQENVTPPPADFSGTN